MSMYAVKMREFCFVNMYCINDYLQLESRVAIKLPSLTSCVKRMKKKI